METKSPHQCKQCDKPAKMKKEIRRNRQDVILVFCSEECASHYQMGCEG